MNKVNINIGFRQALVSLDHPTIYSKETRIRNGLKVYVVCVCVDNLLVKVCYVYPCACWWKTDSSCICQSVKSRAYQIRKLGTMLTHGRSSVLYFPSGR